MQKFNVNIKNRMVSPKFWNEFVGRQYILDIDERTINGEALLIEDDPKSKLIVFGSWRPYAYIYAEYLDYKKQKELDQQNYINQQNIFYENIKDEAIKFNNSLNVPVKWSSEIKQVLSGLRDGSNGCGSKKNTVRHIFIHEDVDSGRMKRQKNNFLCSSVKSKWGGNWSGVLGESGLEFKVTCKQCLKLSERFTNPKI